MQRITPRVAMEIIAHEGIVREAYRDSTGTWTWSVGLTSASGHKVERYIGNPQSLRRCLEVFVWALERYADDVRAVFAGEEMMEEEFAAALSFHWNTGAIRRATWVKRWKAGATSAALRESFMQWDKPAAIIPRREAECDLLLKGIWSSDGTATEWTSVRADGSIDWSKSRRVQIEDTLRELLAAPAHRKEPPMTENVPVPAGRLARTTRQVLLFVAGLLASQIGFLSLDQTTGIISIDTFALFEELGWTLGTAATGGGSLIWWRIVKRIGGAL